MPLSYVQGVCAVIAGMEDMKKIGKTGGRALPYFEAVSTFAMIIGLVAGQFVPAQRSRAGGGQVDQ